MRIILPSISCLLALATSLAKEPDRPDSGWQRHVIDHSSRGADGVRLGDLNRDGLPDLVTGWEEGGIVRAYLNPGPRKVTGAWPAVTIGRTGSPEDAVFVDLDGDGGLDVVSSSEGKVRTVFVHWAPADPDRLLDEDAWKCEPVPATVDREAWMYALPMQIDGEHGPDLVIGSKGKEASISWLEAPEDPRDLVAWKLHRLRDAGWIMSLAAEDVDADGRSDIVFTDRKGQRRGAFWLRRPRNPLEPWVEHAIGSRGKEVMFLTIGDLDSDGACDVVVTTRDGNFDIYYRRPEGDSGVQWRHERVPLPFGLPFGKSLAIADIDGDGNKDLASTSRGVGAVRCVAWQGGRGWEATDIGGLAGRKFDLIEPLDLDGDGDLDLVTCEEADNLGVIWYENPRIRD